MRVMKGALDLHLVQEWIMELITSGFITGVLLLGSICWCQIAPYFGSSHLPAPAEQNEQTK